MTSTPGFSQDENGRYHFQGGHSQQLLVIDGQPIGDQIGITFSNSLDPGVAEGIEIITGGIPAEYGEKANGVINLTTRSGLGYERRQGRPRPSAARSSRRATASLAAGGGNSRLGWFASVDGSRSDRFLDPVSFDNFHNVGDTGARLPAARLGLGERHEQLAPDREHRPDEARRHEPAVAGGGRPGPERRLERLEPEPRLPERPRRRSHPRRPGLRARQPADALFLAVRHAGPGRSEPLAREPGNQPGSLEGPWHPRAQGRRPGQAVPDQGAVLVRHHGPRIQRPRRSDGYNPNLAPYDLTRGGSPFYFTGSKTGSYVAAFVQDNIRWNDLTVNVGLRYDHNNLFLTEDSVPAAHRPRVPSQGDEHRLPRLLQPDVHHARVREHPALVLAPQAASITPPELQDSQQLGGGELFNVSERHDVWNFGIQQGIGSKLRLDVSLLVSQGEERGRPGPVLQHGHRLPAQLRERQPPGLERPARPRAGPRRTARLRLGRPRARASTAIRSSAASSSTPARSTPSAAGASSSTTIRTSRSRPASSTTSAQSGFWAGVTQRYDSGLVTDAGTVEDVLSSPDTAYAAPYHPLRRGPSARQVADGLELLARGASPEVRPAVRAAGRPPERLRRAGALQLPVRLRRHARHPAADVRGAGEVHVLRSQAGDGAAVPGGTAT